MATLTHLSDVVAAPIADDLAASLHRTDSGNAEFFVALYGDRVRYDHARQRWLVWNGHHWRPDADAAVHRLALESVRRRAQIVIHLEIDIEGKKALLKWLAGSESAIKLNALLSLARTMQPIADDGASWDAAPGLLGVPNGVIDLHTGELRVGQPEDRITLCTGVTCDPQASCPRWERFVQEILAGGDEEVAYVQRLCGYSLTGEADADVVAFLMGVGSNGKTTFLTKLKEVAGDYSREVMATALKATRFDRHAAEVAVLEASRLATCEEVGDDKLNSNRLKHLSGGGKVSANRMRQDPREFKQTWMLWLTTNGLPKTDDNSWAFWRRIVAINFPYVFGRDDDPTLEADLKTELPGILAWVVRGAVAYYQHGLGELPPAFVEATQDYREDVDPLEGLFEASVLIKDPNAKTSTADLFLAYQRWARDRVPPLDQFGEQGFAKALSGSFTRARWETETGKVRGFIGVRPGPAYRS